MLTKQKTRLKSASRRTKLHYLANDRSVMVNLVSLFVSKSHMEMSESVGNATNCLKIEKKKAEKDLLSFGLLMVKISVVLFFFPYTFFD